MESNKILIGVQFIDAKKADYHLVFELIVPRDLSVAQLLDGIKYGLAKRKEDAFYGLCHQIYQACISVKDANGAYKRIMLTSHNSALLMRRSLIVPMK